MAKDRERSFAVASMDLTSQNWLRQAKVKKIFVFVRALADRNLHRSTCKAAEHLSHFRPTHALMSHSPACCDALEHVRDKNEPRAKDDRAASAPGCLAGDFSAACGTFRRLALAMPMPRRGLPSPWSHAPQHQCAGRQISGLEPSSHVGRK